MNTLKLDINELEIDANLNEISQRAYNKYFEYNETFKTQIKLLPDSVYQTISFAEVSEPFALVIVSDYNINAKINGFEITNSKMILLNTAINSLQIANVDLKPATVSVYVWGKE